MIESPCIGVCTVIDNKCIGCLRTSEEIKNWLYFSDEERNKITRKCLNETDRIELSAACPPNRGTIRTR